MVTGILQCLPLSWVQRPDPLGAVLRSRDKSMTPRSRLPTRLHILGLLPARLRPVQCPTVCITWVTGYPAELTAPTPPLLVQSSLLNIACIRSLVSSLLAAENSTDSRADILFYLKRTNVNISSVSSQTPPSREKKRSGEPSQISWASARFWSNVT